MRAIIVDDEKLARDEMRFLLAGEEGVEIVGEAAGGREAVGLIADSKPDVVFLDIQMPEMDGFAVVHELLQRGEIPIIIFATAYNQYAIKAFEVHALDYLLKPIERDRLREALARARAAAPRVEDFAKRLRKLAESIRIGASFLTRIVVRKGEDVEPIEVARVSMLHREGSRVTAHTDAGRFPTNYRDLDEVEVQLDPAIFIRLGGDYLVNIRRIKDVVPWSGGSYMMTLDDADASEVRLNRSQAKLLKSKAERFF